MNEGFNEQQSTRKVTMKQQSFAIAPHQVIQITEEPKEKSRITNNCYVKAATVLGVIQIICGIIALVVLYNDNIFWTFTLFFFTGMLTISEAHSMNRWLMAASMVLAINSAVSAAFLLINAGISQGFSYDYENSSYGGNSNNSDQSYNYRYMADVLKVVMAWTMLIASTVSTFITASILITAFAHLRSTGQSKLRESGRFVQYNCSHLDLSNHQDLQNIPIQLLSPNLTNIQDFSASGDPPPPGDQNSVSEEDSPKTTPNYLEVSGLGENS